MTHVLYNAYNSYLISNAATTKFDVIHGKNPCREERRLILTPFQSTNLVLVVFSRWARQNTYTAKKK
jgi:hypothetical protein